jgi:hypothetical protein
MDSRIWSAVLVHTNGRGLSFQVSIQARMSASFGRGLVEEHESRGWHPECARDRLGDLCLDRLEGDDDAGRVSAPKLFAKEAYSQTRGAWSSGALMAFRSPPPLGGRTAKLEIRASRLRARSPRRSSNRCTRSRTHRSPTHAARGGAAVPGSRARWLSELAQRETWLVPAGRSARSRRRRSCDRPGRRSRSRAFGRS